MKRNYFWHERKLRLLNVEKSMIFRQSVFLNMWLCLCLCGQHNIILNNCPTNLYPILKKSQHLHDKREMSGEISGGTESMNQAPDWPKQSDKIVTGFFLTAGPMAQFIDYIPTEILHDISLCKSCCQTPVLVKSLSGLLLSQQEKEE